NPSLSLERSAIRPIGWTHFALSFSESAKRSGPEGRSLESMMVGPRWKRSALVAISLGGSGCALGGTSGPGDESSPDSGGTSSSVGGTAAAQTGSGGTAMQPANMGGTSGGAASSGTGGTASGGSPPDDLEYHSLDFVVTGEVTGTMLAFDAGFEITTGVATGAGGLVALSG